MDKNQKLVNFMNIMCNQRTKRRRKFVKYKREKCFQYFEGTIALDFVAQYLDVLSGILKVPEEQ